MEPVVDVADLRVRRRNVQALDGVSFQAYPGQIILIAGPSGCGKSTLAGSLCGLFARGIPPPPCPRPPEGAGVTGFPPPSGSGPAVERQRCVPLSAGGGGANGSAASPFPPEGAGLTAGYVRVGGQDPLRSGPAQMSRSVGLLFQNPAAQLFCLSVRAEVEAGPRCARLAPDEIAARTDEAMDAVGVSHLASRRPWEISSGEQQRVALAAVLAMRPRTLVLDEPTSYLDDPSCDRLSATLRALADEGVSIIVMEHRWDRLAIEPDLTLTMEEGRVASECRGSVGNALAVPYDGVQRHPLGAPLLEMSCPRVTRGGRGVLEDVAVRVCAGDRLAVVGPNGTGKSTLARAMAGLESTGRGRRNLRARVMLVQSNAAVQLLEDTVGAEVGNDSTAEALGLGGMLQRPPTCLSLGQQMRVVIGAALASRPDVLILDEPSIGQDGQSLARMLEYTDRILGDRGACVIMTHDSRLAKLGAHEVYDVTERTIGGGHAGRAH